MPISPSTLRMYEEWGQKFISYMGTYWLAWAIVLAVAVLLIGVSRFNNNRNRHSQENAISIVIDVYIATRRLYGYHRKLVVGFYVCVNSVQRDAFDQTPCSIRSWHAKSAIYSPDQHSMGTADCGVVRRNSMRTRHSDECSHARHALLRGRSVTQINIRGCRLTSPNNT